MTIETRNRIIRRYMERVHGKKPDTSKSNKKHDGKEGSWLEDTMGVKRNANNKPDLWGYEMKNHTKSKTSFGDWNASCYLFRDEKYFPDLKCLVGRERQKKMAEHKSEFLKIFGRKNSGAYSWSGEPCPKKATDGYNGFGQRIVVKDDDSILIEYSYEKDKRPDKAELVPERFQLKSHALARWSRELIKERVEEKFGYEGWFKCKRKKNGTYNEIVFGDAFDIKQFIKMVKNGDAFFDSGMKERRKDGTDRYRSMWRASNKHWESMETYTHPPQKV